MNGTIDPDEPSTSAPQDAWAAPLPVSAPEAGYGELPAYAPSTPEVPGYPQALYPQPAYPQAGYPQPGYPQPAYPQQGYQERGYPQTAYPQTAYPQTAYPQGVYPQPGYPQQAYPPAYVPPGYAPAWPYPARTRTNGLAIAALILGLLGGLLGIVFGHIALRQIKTTGEEGRTLALIGLTAGYAHVGLWVVLGLGALIESAARH